MRTSSPKYTRRHYKDIADTISQIRNRNEKWDQITIWLEKLPLDNPRFDKVRFLDACGEKE